MASANAPPEVSVQTDEKTTSTRGMTKAQRDQLRAAEIRRRLGCPYLDEDEAAAYLHVSPSTLATYRTTGGGPKYRKHFGRVCYLIDELDEWSDSTARLTTSDKKE